MKLFFAYCRQARWTALFYLLACAVFAVSFFLYRLPLAAVLYPAAISALIGIGFFIGGFWRVRAHHRQLEALRQQTAAMIADLPAPCGVEAADYQALVRTLQTEMAEREARADARYQDMLEYYTVWAHQIKTPIASMRLTLQNEDTPLARSLSSDLFRIEQYADMVLAFLRLDSPATDYVFREQSLDAIVRQAVRRFAPEFIGRHLQLDYHPCNAAVVTDEKWLAFVIEQVLSNALKYTREGGITIYMADEHTLCVADTGIGIAPEDLPRIFERGYTGYNGRSDKRASGIGLYLCRRVCRALGADITVHSTVGEGTVVSIRLEQYPLRAE